MSEGELFSRFSVQYLLHAKEHVQRIQKLDFV